MQNQNCDDYDAESEFKPLTKEQAEVLRGKLKITPVRRILLWQVWLMVVLVLIVALCKQNWRDVFAVFYGCCVVVLPTALMVFKVQKFQQSAGLAFQFLIWNLVKQVLMLVMLIAAPILFREWLNFWLLFLGVFATINIYWCNLFTNSKKSNCFL